MGNIGTGSLDALSGNFPIRDHKTFRTLHFNHGAEDCRHTFEVVNPNFCQRSHTSIVIPARPSRACISVQGAGRMHFADRTILNPSTKCAKCGRAGQYRKQNLVERYGAEIRLPDLREEIAQCQRHGLMHDACMVRYVDLIPPDT